MKGFAGTGALMRLAIRRDRVVIPVSMALLVLTAGGSAQATVALYTKPEEAVAAAQAINASPALLGMYGPIADPTNPDSVAAFKAVTMGAIGMALLAYALVRRHTRTEEEAGRTELVGAGVVGRRAPLTAAILLSVAVTVVTSMLAALSLVAAGLGASGSFAFGAVWLTVGLAFTGITAVAAQLTTTARGCGAWALGAMGLAYLLRAVGDTSTGPASALTWLSPFGWGEKLEIFGADRFVVLLVPVVFSLLMVGLAYLLLERRDLGSGLMATRPGPAAGAASLRSPLALAWRLQRGALYGWTAGFAVLGLVLGGVAMNVGDFVNDPKVEDMLRQMGGDATTLTDLFLSTEVNFLAIAAAAYGISAALKLKSEESDGHSEQVLATPTTRRALLASHAAIALLGSALVMVVFGLGLAVSYGRQSGGVATAIGRLLPTVLAPVPAIWVCVGLALVIFGALPGFVTVAWGLLAAFLLLGEFGSLLGLPESVIDVSPFVHGSVIPGGVVHGTPLVALALIAAALAVTAAGTFRRRDLATA
jgi:ABC-2 type transport system permease protein